MNDNLNKPRPRRPRINQFKSVQQFWAYHTNHPEAFSQMDFTGIAEMAEKVRERTQNSPLHESLDSRGGAGGGATPHSKPEPTRTNLDKSEQKNVPNGNKTASKNGKERERTGRIGQSTSEPSNPRASEPYKIGPGNPPKEHQFQKGNPGGPGGPLGPRSMRKYIRTILFGDEVEDGFAMEVTKSLFRQAFKGNTHAIRIICENGNNRRVTKR
jgi:hypothetical protein